MVLVDTSVWINHLRDGETHLEELLFDGDVVCHPNIISELACGNIKNRKEIISLLQSLPLIREIDFQEFLYFVEQNKLSGKGIGFVDIHLLASSRLDKIPLWTEDKRLGTAAKALGLNYKPQK